jgi:hypothetical protein
MFQIGARVALIALAHEGTPPPRVGTVVADFVPSWLSAPQAPWVKVHWDDQPAPEFGYRPPQELRAWDQGSP